MNETQRARVDWKGIAGFVVLTFLITWPVELAAYAQGVRYVVTPSGADPRGLWLLAAVAFIPAFAAWIVRSTLTKEGFGSAGLRFGPWQYYALVWIGMPWLYFIIYALTAVAGAGHFDPSLRAATEVLQHSGRRLDLAQFLTLTLAWTLSVGIIFNMIFTFGEEFGWTGFLFPKLLPLGRWRATALYGVIWGLWHAPLVLGGFIYGFAYGGFPVTGIVMTCFWTIAVGSIQAALRIRSNSVVLTTFFHSAFNSQARGIVLFLVFGVTPLIGGTTGVIGIVVTALIGAALLATTPRSKVDAVLASLPAKSPVKRTGRSRSS